MKYTVRAPEGELTFESFGELERAYFSGLVDPDDEVLEEGATRWRKAVTFSVLRRPRPLTAHDKESQKLWLALAIVLATVALWALSAAQLGWKRYFAALAAALLVAAVLGRMTRIASKRRR